MLHATVARSAVVRELQQLCITVVRIVNPIESLNTDYNDSNDSNDAIARGKELRV